MCTVTRFGFCVHSDAWRTLLHVLFYNSLDHYRPHTSLQLSVSATGFQSSSVSSSRSLCSCIKNHRPTMPVTPPSLVISLVPIYLCRPELTRYGMSIVSGWMFSYTPSYALLGRLSARHTHSNDLSRAAVVRRTRRADFARRAFAVCGLDIWYSLPVQFATVSTHRSSCIQGRSQEFHLGGYKLWCVSK